MEKIPFKNMSNGKYFPLQTSSIPPFLLKTRKSLPISLLYKRKPGTIYPYPPICTGLSRLFLTSAMYLDTVLYLNILLRDV